MTRMTLVLVKTMSADLTSKLFIGSTWNHHNIHLINLLNIKDHIAPSRVPKCFQKPCYAMDSNQGTNTAERGGARAAPPGNITDSRSSLSWRGWVIPVVYVIYGLIVAAATPFAIIDFTKASKDDKFKRTLALVGFVPMVISIPISLWGIVNHMIYFTRPNLQKHIIR